MTLKITTLILFVWISLFATAQIPAGYYDSASGLNGSALKTSLYNIIKGHTSISYSNLWTAFNSTDIKSGSTIWDVYTDIPSSTPVYTFTYSTDQCGTYTNEGDCYNREHSFPKNWFASASPMYTDLFHIYPTDGKVNGERSNYPYGTVSSPTYTSSNGSKKGNCSYPGYTGTVFEPIDEYKGDIARTYFYMATRYENLIASWVGNDANGDQVLSGNSYPAYQTWFINMLLAWNTADPVSQKEIDRNNEIYNNFQHNRNPFIDHPEYANDIWAPGSIKPEPSNPASEFSSKSITLNWTDATGANLPDAYIIRMSSAGYSSIGTPVDGTPINDDSNNKNIAYGVETCTFSGLQASTTYYFKIYSYTGSGAAINYKTDGSVPQVSKTTN